MPGKKLRILAAGDLHGDIRHAYRLAQKAADEDADIVVLCGDLSNNDDPKYIIGPFVKKGKKVLFVPGNHESQATAEFLAERYKVRNLHGKYAKYYDIGFFGCGGANVGAFMIGEEDIFQKLSEGFEKTKHL